MGGRRKYRRRDKCKSKGLMISRDTFPLKARFQLWLQESLTIEIVRKFTDNSLRDREEREREMEEGLILNDAIFTQLPG